jgi:hypothetical protein
VRSVEAAIDVTLDGSNGGTCYWMTLTELVATEWRSDPLHSESSEVWVRVGSAI